MDLDVEDALKFLLETLAQNPEVYQAGQRPALYDVWIPNAVVAFLRGNSVQDTGDPEFYHREDFSAVWSSFYDAAWELCRRGIFRLSMKRAEGMGSTWGTLGDGYSLTSNGRVWLSESETRYFPTDPTRYSEALAKPAGVLGGAFLQRASEAAKCHQFGNYLACCAMCGAAAESVLLDIAFARTDNEELVLKLYRQAGGRQKVMGQIFATTSGELRRRFEIGFELLTLWRDDAAHGRLSDIDEVEAYTALGQLMHLAMLTFDRWTELTGKAHPSE